MVVATLGYGLIALFVISFFATISSFSSKSAIQPITPEDQIKSIFGVPKSNNDNGIVQLQYSDQNALIHYRIFPLGAIMSYPEEIGVELASKIHKLFTENTQLNKMSIFVIFPFDDKYGNTTWKQYCSFEMTRTTHDKINWDNFASQNLLGVAENLQYYR